MNETFPFQGLKILILLKFRLSGRLSFIEGYIKALEIVPLLKAMC